MPLSQHSTTHTVIFEKPLNETMRLLLRLDHLFKRYDSLIATAGNTGLDEQLTILCRLIALTDRADLKSKLTQMTHALASRLQKWQQHADAHQAPIVEALAKCEQFLTYFDSTRDKIGHTLREHGFMKQVTAQFNHPGGLCDFTLPSYALWHKQPAARRAQDIEYWMHEFEILQSSIELLLHFIRLNSTTETITVTDSFYQQAMDAQKSTQLLQVALDASLMIYPKISVGRHHLSIHFHHVADGRFEDAEPCEAPFACTLQFCDL
jgi:cell division protein ZapD